MIDVTSLSAYELSQKLYSGEISSVDLCTAYLDRIKKFEKDVQAWQFIDKKLLIEKAEEADIYRKSGKPLGPLHGMPVAIKDIIGTYDMPTECGTVFRKKMSNSQDSEIVNLLKNAGAIIKTLDEKPFLYGKEDYRNPSLLIKRAENLND